MFECKHFIGFPSQFSSTHLYSKFKRTLAWVYSCSFVSFFREGMEKMIDVYRQNPSLGDPATIEQNLSDNAKELDALNVDLHRYQVRDYCFAMLSTRCEFCSRHFEPDPPPQISV